MKKRILVIVAIIALVAILSVCFVACNEITSNSAQNIAGGPVSNDSQSNGDNDLLLKFANYSKADFENRAIEKGFEVSFTDYTTGEMSQYAVGGMQWAMGAFSDAGTGLTIVCFETAEQAQNFTHHGEINGTKEIVYNNYVISGYADAVDLYLND